MPGAHRPARRRSSAAGAWSRPDAAAWLNGVALVSLELDEGHKYAKGHPAAHGFPAVLALAAELDSTGADTAAALLAAYEVAARFGRATTLRAGAHPHGSWGVPGAAAGLRPAARPPARRGRRRHRHRGRNGHRRALRLGDPGQPGAQRVAGRLGDVRARRRADGGGRDGPHHRHGRALARHAARRVRRGGADRGPGHPMGHHARLLQAARVVLLHPPGGGRRARTALASGVPGRRHHAHPGGDPRPGRRVVRCGLVEPAFGDVLDAVRGGDRRADRRGGAGEPAL